MAKSPTLTAEAVRLVHPHMSEPQAAAYVAAMADAAPLRERIAGHPVEAVLTAQLGNIVMQIALGAGG